MTDAKIGYTFLGTANRYAESIGYNLGVLLDISRAAKPKEGEELTEDQLAMVSEVVDSIIETEAVAGRTKEGILAELKTDRLRAVMFLVEVQADALINLIKESVMVMQERGYIPPADERGMISMDAPLEDKLVKPN